MWYMNLIITYYYVVVLKESGLDPIAGPIYLGTK